MKKMDEMEKMITLKSIRVSWLLIAIFLFGWGIKNYIEGLGQTLPMALFTSQVVIVVALLIVLMGCILYYFKIGF